MKNTKIIAIIVLVVAVLLLIIQNTAYVPINLFFFRLEMPMILLLLITTGLGILIGLLIAFTGKGRQNK